MHCILGGVGHLLEMHEFPLSVSFLKMQPVENAGVRSMRSSPVIVCLFFQDWGLTVWMGCVK